MMIFTPFDVTLYTESRMAGGAVMNQIGRWLKDSAGLPCFEYTGALPYEAPEDKGQKIKLPEDPWFILGNYRMTLFSHVSGENELISGQRSWMRLNKGESKASGKNEAAITIDGNQQQLTGINSFASSVSCQKIHGCGFAYFKYNLDDIELVRKLSVKPSHNPYDGASAFLLTVNIKNNSNKSHEIKYKETIGVNFAEIRENFALKKITNAYSAEGQLGKIEIKVETEDPLLFGTRDDIAVTEGFPPTVFMKSLSEAAVINGNDNELAANATLNLNAGEDACIQLIIGFAHDDLESVCYYYEKGNPAAGKDNAIEPVSVYASEWKKLLPDFPNETDEDLKRELIWHAYTLEAMATYSEYYEETKIPQGIIYDYYWGQHASARDNFQHALPLVYYNSVLAKSVLKYMLKRTTAFGEIRLIEYGNGYAANEQYFTSDQQLYFFLYLCEYLRVTKDYDILQSEITPYPVKNTTSMKVYKLVEKCFLFLRDTIGIGEHGLVRLLNSDWNDAVYYIIDAPYNKVFSQGESHMNTAMAISILQNLIPQLEKSGISEVLPLCKSMSIYRTQLLGAFQKDMGNCAFPLRMYFNGKAYGKENMFLEPQGFTLQITELSAERKKILYEEMKKRLYAGEKIGAREQQKPEFEDDGFDKGSRENGGFWYALNAPVILGVASFDKDEAWKLLEKMTLSNLSKEFPQYWSSYWSAADTLESSLIPGSGCTDQSDDFWREPVFCAHPHAWILYCYYRLKEMQG